MKIVITTAAYIYDYRDGMLWADRPVFVDNDHITNRVGFEPGKFQFVIGETMILSCAKALVKILGGTLTVVNGPKQPRMYVP